MTRHFLFFALLATPAQADTGGGLRLWVGSGYDTNARRDFVKDDRSNGVEAEPDVVLSAIGSADGLYQGESAQLGGGYDIGLRKFLRLSSEDVVIQSATAGGAIALGRTLGLAVAGRVKDRRGADRDYSDLAADASLEFVPDASVDCKLRGGGHRFLYWNRIAYSFAATELGLNARYRFDKRHSAFVFGDVGFRRYQANAEHDEDDPDPPPAAPRRDLVLSGGAGYSFRGPFTLTLTYSYTEQTSNSFGETVLRHRLSATAGLRLPASLTVLAQGGLQLSSFPDGVSISGGLNITEDDESHNSLSVKLVRPVSAHVDAEVRYALYQDRLPKNRFEYLRQHAWVGLSWRL